MGKYEFVAPLTIARMFNIGSMRCLGGFGDSVVLYAGKALACSTLGDDYGASDYYWRARQVVIRAIRERSYKAGKLR